MKISYSILQSFFEKQLPSIEDVVHTFTFGAFEIESVEEVHGEHVLDVKVLPNRAHDCLSWIGIAREYALLSKMTLREDIFTNQHPSYPNEGTSISIATDSFEKTSVHTLSLITNVKVQPSPEWLVKALESCRQRSINNVVDATNYIMLMYGSPTHAFDADKLSIKDGMRGIRIRDARENETVTILGGKVYTLSPQSLVLADINTDEVLDIAGTKGGVHAELTNQTTNIVLSAAKFDAATIRKSSQKINIRTDASKRFENDIPFLLPFYAQHAVQTLIAELTGGNVKETIGIAGTFQPPAKVSIPLPRVSETLGVEVSQETIVDIFTRSHAQPEVTTDTLTITPPWWRLDLEINEDVIEEVGRVVGYDTVPETQLPQGRTQVIQSPLFSCMDSIRSLLDSEGFTEIRTYSLAATGEITLANALSEDKAALRSNLRDGMVLALKQNEYHAPEVGEYSSLQLYEIGHVFTNEGEFVHLSVGVKVLTGKKREVKEQDALVSLQKKISDSLNVSVDAQMSESVLTCNISQYLETALPQTVSHLPVSATTVYKPLVHFPAALRDVAFWASSESDWREVIKQAAGPLCTRVDQFDAFTKDGKTSYAYHLVFQSQERTLTDADIDPYMKAVYESLIANGCETR